MKISKILGVLTVALALSNAAFGAPTEENDLNLKRSQAVIKYVYYLGNADYKKLANLFDKNGIVVSTSRGSVNAKEFFYDFLPNVVSGKTEVKETFMGYNDFAARFSLELNLKDGEKVKGEYVDEFVFMKNSAKFQAVYMFENLNFPSDI